MKPYSHILGLGWGVVWCSLNMSLGRPHLNLSTVAHIKILGSPYCTVSEPWAKSHEPWVINLTPLSAAVLSIGGYIAVSSGSKRALLEILMTRLNRREEAIWATASASPWIRSKLASVVWRAYATDRCMCKCMPCMHNALHAPAPWHLSPSIILFPIVALGCIVGKFHCCEVHCRVGELLEAHCKKNELRNCVEEGGIVAVYRDE